MRCVCGKKIGPDPRNFNQRVNLGRNDLLIRTFLKSGIILKDKEYPITIYHIAPFNKDLWSLLKSSQECPPGESKITNKCLHNSCIIKICPYGLK
ncbi:hypothetical protein ACBP59_08050 [Escherichia coli]